MKYFDEFVENGELNAEAASVVKTFARTEKECGISFDDIVTAEQADEVYKHLAKMWATGTAYKVRRVLDKYILFVDKKLGREPFKRTRSGLISSQRLNTASGKVIIPYVSFDQLIVDVNEQIDLYAKDKVSSSVDIEKVKSSFVLIQALFSLLWNGFSSKEICGLLMSEIDIDKHEVRGKIIRKGWNYIAAYYHQDSYYTLCNNGFKQVSCGKSKYYIKARKATNSPTDEPVSENAVRKHLGNFSTITGMPLYHQNDIMIVGALSEFVKTEDGLEITHLNKENVVSFVDDYCGGTNYVAAKTLYEMYDMYKTSLLKLLAKKLDLNTVI